MNDCVIEVILFVCCMDVRKIIRLADSSTEGGPFMEKERVTHLVGI